MASIHPNGHTSTTVPPKKVAIIGAGVAGLQAARALQKAGIAFEIFERCRFPAATRCMHMRVWCHHV